MLHYVGMDLETTGLDKYEDVVCEIGVVPYSDDGALNPDRWFASDVGHETFHFDPKSLEVNGFTVERIHKAPRADAVTEALGCWVEETFGVSRPEYARMVAIGWSVDRFDLTRLERDHPAWYLMFSNSKYIDLNMMCTQMDRQVGPDYPRSRVLKRNSKQYAQNALAAVGIEPAWHSAAYDAASGLLSWDFLIDVMIGKRYYYDVDAGDTATAECYIEGMEPRTRRTQIETPT